MDDISVLLDGGRTEFKPGDSVSGQVVWSLGQSARSIEVRLFWFTSGISPREVGMIERETVSAPPLAGNARFKFQLPAGPWSCKGALVGLSWAIEAIVLPSFSNARVFLELGPAGRRVPLRGEP